MQRRIELLATRNYRPVEFACRFDVQVSFGKEKRKRMQRDVEETRRRSQKQQRPSIFSSRLSPSFHLTCHLCPKSTSVGVNHIEFRIHRTENVVLRNISNSRTFRSSCFPSDSQSSTSVFAISIGYAMIVVKVTDDDKNVRT